LVNIIKTIDNINVKIKYKNDEWKIMYKGEKFKTMICYDNNINTVKDLLYDLLA
jgi:hypothetical protein